MQDKVFFLWRAEFSCWNRYFFIYIIPAYGGFFNSAEDFWHDVVYSDGASEVAEVLHILNFFSIIRQVLAIVVFRAFVLLTFISRPVFPAHFVI